MGSSTRELASAVRHKSTQIPQQHLPSGDPSRRATMVGGAAGGSCPKGSPTPRRPGERGRPQSPHTKEPQPEANPGQPTSSPSWLKSSSARPPAWNRNPRAGR